MITFYAQGWTLSRMPAVDRNVLRLGAFEVLYLDDVPDSVAVTAVPRRLRTIVAVAALGVLAAMTVVALRLPSSSVGVVAFGTVDQVAMFGLGIVVAGAILLLGRPRVDADEHGVRVRNVATSQDVPWERVTAELRELKALDVQHVFPMHCSGANFLEAAKRDIPQTLVLCTTGSRFTFGA